MTKLRAYTEQPFNSVNSCNTFIYLPCYNNHECLNMMLDHYLMPYRQREKAPDPRLYSNIPRTASRQMRVGFHTLANTLTPPPTDY